MADLVKGDVVVVPFPFTDLSASKRRPALVAASLPGDDAILCQITSRDVRDRVAVPLDSAGFASGGLRQVSNVRPNRIFTAHRSLVLYRVGALKPEAMAVVTRAIVSLFER